MVEFHSMLVWVYRENQCETHTVYGVSKPPVTILAESDELKKDCIIQIFVEYLETASLINSKNG